MLILLINELLAVFPLLNAFAYITTRTVAATFTSGIIVFFLSPTIIRYLKKHQKNLILNLILSQKNQNPSLKNLILSLKNLIPSLKNLIPSLKNLILNQNLLMIFQNHHRNYLMNKKVPNYQNML